MISLEKWKILTSLQKLPKNVGDLEKFSVTKDFKMFTLSPKNRPFWSLCSCFYSSTGLDLSKLENTLLFQCTETTESKPVKVETGPYSDSYFYKECFLQ